MVSPDGARSETEADRIWRIVVADDHAVTRSGIRMMLESIDGVEVVGEAATGSQALRLCEELEPDAVLMDIEMPDMDGIHATEQIRAEHPGVGVLMLTVHEHGDAVFEAMRAGASGYLPKSASLDEVREAVDTLRAGGTYMTPSLAGLAIRSLTRKVDDVREAAKMAEMTTPREREVLELLSQGLSARAIARRLGISERTVNTHIGHVYRKLGVNNRVDAVLAGLKLGLVEAQD